MRLISSLAIVIPMIFLLSGCPMAAAVDGDDDDSVDDYAISGERLPHFERVCDNDIDDDRDGEFDCADPDCDLNGDCEGWR